MTSFFHSVVEFLSLAWDMVTNIVKSLITTFTLLQTQFISFGTFLALMPSFIAASAMITLGVCLLNYLIGRIGGGK